MGIEAGRDQQQLRAEVVDRRQHLVGPDIAEAEATTARRQQDVADVADAALAHAARVREQPGLVGAVVGHLGVGLEDRLGAIAVVHVEIDDGDALQAIFVTRIGGSDGHVVEQAEAHRGAGGGVVAGRAHRAEGDRVFAEHHRIHRGHTGAGRMQGGAGRAGRGHGVHVDQAQRLGLRLEHQVDQFAVVDPGQLAQLCRRCLAPVQRVGEGRVQGVEHHLQALRGFGMATAGIVLQTGGVGENQHAGGGSGGATGPVRRGGGCAATALRRGHRRGPAPGPARTTGPRAG
ncbi:hypothetical protein D3C71_1269350 [compost metagenome]